MVRKMPFWEGSYKRSGKLDTFGAGKPSEALVKIASQFPAGTRALDLGCGEGRNALYMAGLGFQVSAFDISLAGIGKLLQTAEQKRLHIDASVADMREYVFPHKFDLIVCEGCLHLIKREEWKILIQNMKKSTTPGGWHVIGVFTDTLPEPEDLKGFMVGLFKEGELLEQYKDWEILESRAYQFKDEHPGGLFHEHSANELVARKPV